MNPELHLNDQTSPAQTKHLRGIITVGLLLVLVAIVAGYIYYGIQLASQEDVPLAETVPTSGGDERRQAILDALVNAPTATPEERAEVLKALESAPVVDPERRSAVLEALNN
jgi:hypothetical protein